MLLVSFELDDIDRLNSQYVRTPEPDYSKELRTCTSNLKFECVAAVPTPAHTYAAHVHAVYNYKHPS